MLLNEQKHKQNMDRLRLLHQKISNLPDVLFLLLMLIIVFVLAAIISPLFDFFIDLDKLGDFYPGMDLDQYILIGGLVSPIYETLIWQCIPIEICLLFYKKKLKTKPNYALIVLISAILFGIAHYPAYAAADGFVFGILKAFYSGTIGLVLAYTYVTYKSKAGRPYLATATLHMMCNVSFLMIYYFSS